MSKEYNLFLEDDLIGTFKTTGNLLKWVRKILNDAEIGQKIIIEVAETTE